MDDLLAGYRYSDLLHARIVSSRSDLNRKQRKHGFPLPIKTGERTAWFPASEVNEWVRSRAALRNQPKALPDISPALPTPNAAPARDVPAAQTKGHRLEHGGGPSISENADEQSLQNKPVRRNTRRHHRKCPSF
jgi:predicted DNA-binding transcriptional regulator AlpA